jgi:hypothetical protein
MHLELQSADDIKALQSFDPASLVITGSNSKIKVDVKVDRGDRATYHLGETMALKVTVDHDCYVTIYNIDSQEKVHLLFPNGYQRDNSLKAGKVYEIPPPDAAWELRLSGQPGHESLLAIATEYPLNQYLRAPSLTNPFPDAPGNAEDYLSRSVMPELKALSNAPYATDVVRYWLEPSTIPVRFGQ